MLWRGSSVRGTWRETLPRPPQDMQRITLDGFERVEAQNLQRASDQQCECERVDRKRDELSKPTIWRQYVHHMHRTRKKLFVLVTEEEDALLSTRSSLFCKSSSRSTMSGADQEDVKTVGSNTIIP